MKVEKIKQIFALYDYELLDENEKFLVFSEKHSMYPGIEIVQISSGCEEEIQLIKSEYSQQEYAVRLCSSSEVEHIEEYLFDWFFRVKQTNLSIIRRYKEYGEDKLRGYGLKTHESHPYEFIDIPYKVETIVDGIFDLQEGDSHGLIKSIRKDLQEEGPKLIIVEAAAGYGKTSTAMELLYSYRNEEHGVRPFYMELYKDRQAATFHYLFLSQIHREFQVLMDDKIVNYNIKQGRIPLIIDGFDELLSEDLDKGNATKANRKGETMLSTIAELLTDNTKIVLTTRKTAILSGDDFLNWYQSKLANSNNIKVVRYILGQPLLDKWLEPERLRLVEDKLLSISNPVLLGYLHYLNDEDFKSEVDSAKLIENYIKRILEREVDRQDLTLTVAEQKKVFSRLASAFAYEDITSDSRTNVKDDILLSCSEMLEQHATLAKDSKSIANTLANHAVLDRKNSNNIGFINDFVLGLFLGYAIVDNDRTILSNYDKISMNFIDKLVNTFSSCELEMRENLWMQLKDFCIQIPDEYWLLIDLKLMHRNMRNYDNTFFDGCYVADSKLGFENCAFSSCHFVNFTFSKVTIDFSKFTNCTFINCNFNQSSLNGTIPADMYNCIIDGNIINFAEEELTIEEDRNTESEDSYMHEMLSHYFQVDGKTRKMQMISKLKLLYEDNRLFRRIFSKLVNNKFVVTNGDKTHITSEGVQYYKN